MVSFFSSMLGREVYPTEALPSFHRRAWGWVFACISLLYKKLAWSLLMSVMDFKLGLFFGPSGKLQTLLFPAEDCVGVRSREDCWLTRKAGSSLSASSCRPGQISLQRVTFPLGSWKQTSALKCGHAAYFAAFQATFSSVPLISYFYYHGLCSDALQQLPAFGITAAPLTMRRAEVWQHRRTRCLSHVSRLGAGQALGYRLSPPQAPTYS